MTLALDAKAVYITPLGRKCRWMPLGGKVRRAGWYYFVYLLPHCAHTGPMGRPSEVEGFMLTRRALRILQREEVAHAPAR